MEMPKPSDDDKARFRALVPGDPRVELKPMFGNLGAFVNGNMFMGLFGSTVGVKVAPADLVKLAELPGAGPFGPAERPMGGYLALPADVAADRRKAGKWTKLALEFVATLPPKAATPRKK